MQSKRSICAKFGFLILLFAFALFGLPLAADASWWNPLTWGDELAEFIVKLIIAAITAIPAFIFFVVAGVANWFITLVMNIGVFPGGDTTPIFVTDGWNFSRQFVNMLFLLILVFIGLATILRLREYELQKTLPKLIVIALLVNFSGVFVGLIVDIGNLLTNFFISTTGKFGSETFEQIYTAGDNYINQLTSGGDKFLEIFVKGVVYGLVMWLFYAISALAYFAVLLIFFLRQIVLWVLVILAPFAFAAYILPATKGWWSRWLGSLTQWAFVGVPIGFFLWLSNRVMTGPELYNAGDRLVLENDVNIVQDLIVTMLVPFTGIVLLLVGITLSLSMAPGSIRAVTTFARKAGTIAAGVLAAKAVSRIAEKTRGRIERTAAAANPNWGKDKTTGENKKGIGAWAQRGLGGMTGYTQRGVGKLGMQTIVQQDEKNAQKAAKKAQGQSVIQNLSDLRQAGTPGERRTILKAMAAKGQLRDAGNANVVGADNILKPGEIQGAYRNAMQARDVDTAESVERGFIGDKDAVQTFAQVQNELSAKAQDQYRDRTGGDHTYLRDEHNNPVQLPNGVSSEEYDRGIRSYEEKIYEGTRTQEEFKQFQRGWQRKDHLMEIAHRRGSAQQHQQAAVAFGQPFVQRFEDTKKPASYYNEIEQKGVRLDVNGLPEFDAATGQPVERIYGPRSPGVPPWEAAVGASRNLGVSPKEGAETTKQAGDLRRLSTLWSKNYGDPKVQEAYRRLQGIIQRNDRVNHRKTLVSAIEDPKRRAEETEAIEEIQARNLGVWNDVRNKMYENKNPEIRRVWMETDKILGRDIKRGRTRTDEEEGEEDEEEGETPPGGGTPRRPRGGGGPTLGGGPGPSAGGPGPGGPGPTPGGTGPGGMPYPVAGGSDDSTLEEASDLYAEILKTPRDERTPEQLQRLEDLNKRFRHILEVGSREQVRLEELLALKTRSDEQQEEFHALEEQLANQMLRKISQGPPSQTEELNQLESLENSKEPLDEAQIRGAERLREKKFIPEAELTRIRQAPRAEQGQRLQEFKEKLAAQKEGLAKTQEGLIQTIRENPDATFADLSTQLDTLAAQYKLTGEQRRLGEEVLQEYTEKHAKVREVRQQYPDDKELYQALFGARPKGKVEIIEGPMTLYVRANNADDYARIYAQHFLREGGEATPDDRQKAEKTGGVSIGTSLIPGLAGTIIAENATGRQFESRNQSKEVQQHEEQHAINRLFDVRVRRFEKGTFYLTRITDPTATPKDREALAKPYLRQARRNVAEDRAKDEILAYFKSDTNPEETFTNLTTPEEKGGLYDYLKQQKGEEGSARILSQLGVPNAEKIVKEVYEDEYRQLLRDSIDTAQTLKKAGYSGEQVIALLQQEPLSRWKKTTSRLLQQNESMKMKKAKKAPKK